MDRDLRWDILLTTSKKLADSYDPGRVRAAERWRGRWVVAGIEAGQFGLWVPVMRRRVFTRDWEELLPIQEAAARAAGVLREGT